MALSPSAQESPMPVSPLSRFSHPAPWWAIARGTASVLIVAAVVVPIVCLGWTALAIFAAVVVGLNLGLWSGRDSAVASLAGAVLMPSIGLVIAIYSDVQMFGPDAGPIALNETSDHRYAASFRFADARVATEFTGAFASGTLLGAPAGNIPPTGGWRAAPIVPFGWTPSDPVPAWAVANVSGYGPRDFRTPRNWRLPFRGGVRYVFTLFSPAHSAVERAVERYQLKTANGAPLLYWVEEPHSIIADERTFLAWTVFGGVMMWLLFAVGAAMLAPRMGRVASSE